MTVLVLASELDRTADGVVSGLTERGVPVMRLDLSWFPQRLTLDAEFRDGSSHGHLRTEHHEVDLATVRSVWVRTPSSFQMPEGMSAVEREFAKREAKLGVGGVLLALPGVLWVNRPDLAATAVYRPVQWAVAARCGLTVPRTLVSNDPAAVSRFARVSAPGVVLKPLSTNLIYEDHTYKMGWTRTLSADDFIDLRGIDVTAHLVQDWAPTCWECRVVVVGEDIFFCDRRADHRQPDPTAGPRTPSMTIIVPASTWQPLARRLADELDADGDLHIPGWRDAVLAVPRHEFIPRYYLQDRDLARCAGPHTNHSTPKAPSGGLTWCTHRQR